MAKVKVKVDQQSLRKVIEGKQRLIRENVRTVIRSEAIPILINLIMRGYDDLSERMQQAPEDPTNPANWRDQFEEKLRQDLEENFIVTDKGIKINIGDKTFLGYDPSGETNDPDSNEPLVWLVFYIEGLAGEWAFITPDVYEAFRGQGSYQPDWGRFGAGFLISKREYINEGWDQILPFESVKHPFSGFEPLDIFSEALNEFRLRPFISKAIRAALEGRKL